MKKNYFTIIAVAAMLLMGLSACSQSNANSNGKKVKTLVAYFSATGTTEKVAKQIADLAGADLYQITPVQPYTEADLDWHVETSRSSLEMKDKSSRPEIKKDLKSVEEYDIIYVGFPIWWYTAPTIINTFMESMDFNGKTVIPFATSGGSTIDKAAGDLQEAYPKVNWKEGRLLNLTPEEDIKAWIESNIK
ncbi:MAG: NAD(P)H-dependent oxidoreductase [Muribaculaceae bacterium]|nr:NAD(P)H-dependent oxidoreductase [Muribaculaceae bacterium]